MSLWELRRNRSLGQLSNRTVEKKYNEYFYTRFDLSPELTFPPSHVAACFQLALETSENRYLFSAGAGNLCLFDTSSINNCQFELIHKKNWANDKNNSAHTIAWYPVDTGMFVTGSKNKTVSVWDTNTMSSIHTFQVYQPVNYIEFSSCSKSHLLLAAASDAFDVLLLDLNSGTRAMSLFGHGKQIRSLNWHPQKEFELASGDADGIVLIFDIRVPGKPLMALDKENEIIPRNVANQLSASKRALHVKAHHGVVTKVKYSPNGQHLYTSGTDLKLLKWKANTGHNTMTHFSGTYNRRYVYHFEISATNDYLLYPCQNKIQIYSTKTGEFLTKKSFLKQNKNEKVENIGSVLVGHYTHVLCIIERLKPYPPRIFSSDRAGEIKIWEPRLDFYKPKHTSKYSLQANEDDWSDYDLF